MFGFFDKLSLCKKLRKTAKKDKLPADHILRILADNLEQVIKNKNKTPDMIINAWSVAQKAHSEYLNAKK